MEKFSDQLYEIASALYDPEFYKIYKIKKLLEQGCDINSNIRGFTALHYAVMREHYDLCEFLIKQGANPHIENCDEQTPLQIARGLGRHIATNEKLTNILKESTCTVYRPGMNRRYPESALELYNKHYGLNLTMGPVFK